MNGYVQWIMSGGEKSCSEKTQTFLENVTPLGPELCSHIFAALWFSWLGAGQRTPCSGLSKKRWQRKRPAEGRFFRTTVILSSCQPREQIIVWQNVLDKTFSCLSRSTSQKKKTLTTVHIWFCWCDDLKCQSYAEKQPVTPLYFFSSWF